MKKAKEAKLSDHHRQCRSNGGKTEKTNLSKVLENQHRAFHTLFLNKDAYEIAEILNQTWIDPRFYLVVRTKKSPKL
jgi:hypothetical protein